MFGAGRRCVDAERKARSQCGDLESDYKMQIDANKVALAIIGQCDKHYPRDERTIEIPILILFRICLCHLQTLGTDRRKSLCFVG